MKRFRAVLEPVSHGGLFVVVPQTIAHAAGVQHADRVRGTVNGAPYRSSLMKYGGVFHLGVHEPVIAECGAKEGDRVEVAIERDDAPLETDEVPTDLARALAKRPAAKAAWAELRVSRRRVHVKSVIDAKSPETRARRITRVIEELVGGPPNRAR